MRITVHLDAFDHAAPATYAILWLDKSARRWSREGHAGIDFPSWGTLVYEHGKTDVMAQDGIHPLCVLDGLDLSESVGPFEGETGAVSCEPSRVDAPAHGQWHVQWVDPDDPVAESSVFADDEM
jgi:hypothetical protein